MTASPSRRPLTTEIVLVLLLSLGQSSVYAMVSLTAKLTAGKPLAQQSRWPERAVLDHEAAKVLCRGPGRHTSGTPRLSRLWRSDSIASSSKRKYERGGSGPHVFDERRSSG